ncbi:MAG: HAD family phosphatase [Chryseolinea sp.]
MNEAKAFLFDLNGTMIDDMEYHLNVWYDVIVNELGANLSREEVKLHMYGKNHELLIRIFGEHRFTAEEMDRISLSKERQYQQLYRPHLDLLPGLFSFLDQAYDSKIKMAIGSAAIPYNIDFVLDNLKIRHHFEAIVSAADVSISKPHPETYLKAARLLNVLPADCIVFEDAPKGVEAALRAGMKTVVLTTMHPKEDFQQYDNVIQYVENYLELVPEILCLQ